MNEIQIAEISQLEIEINYYKEQTARNILEIGARLIRAKELVPYGEWGEWLENKVDFSQSMANKFMKVSKEFSHSESIPKVGLSKLILLTTVDEEKRNEFIESHPVEDMTTRELRQAIKDKKELERQIEELKNMPAELVEVEKEVIPKDYISLKHKVEDYEIEIENYEKQMEILERKVKMNQQEASKYSNLKEQIEKLSKEKSDLGRQIKARTELSGLVVRVEHILKTELAPIKYSRAIDEASTDEIVVRNLRDIVARVQGWCNEMYKYLPSEDVIEVEVIDYE